MISAPHAVTDIDQLQVRWFDHWLKGKDTGLLTEPPVRLFDMGGNSGAIFSLGPNSPQRFF